MPGELRLIRRRAELGTRFIGVAVGYRDVEGGVWRAIAPVPPPHRAGRLWSVGDSPARKYDVVVGERAIVIEESHR